ncbi:hypothetical protein B0H11DRAFT_1911767 [Mycena galericulata]|nr:hypothetical protein B0H11DRAFT_1911767 [Mycena galericulata]
MAERQAEWLNWAGRGRIWQNFAEFTVSELVDFADLERVEHRESAAADDDTHIIGGMGAGDWIEDPMRQKIRILAVFIEKMHKNDVPILPNSAEFCPANLPGELAPRLFCPQHYPESNGGYSAWTEAKSQTECGCGPHRRVFSREVEAGI